MIRARASARALLMLVAALSAAASAAPSRQRAALARGAQPRTGRVMADCRGRGARIVRRCQSHRSRPRRVHGLARRPRARCGAVGCGRGGESRAARRTALAAAARGTDRRHHAHGDHRRPRWRARARSATTRDAGRGVLRLQPTGHAIGAGGDAGSASCFLGSDDAHRRTGRHVLVDRRGRGSHRRAARHPITMSCRTGTRSSTGTAIGSECPASPTSSSRVRSSSCHLSAEPQRDLVGEQPTAHGQHDPIAFAFHEILELLGQRARRHAVARAQRELQRLDATFGFVETLGRSDR